MIVLCALYIRGQKYSGQKTPEPQMIVKQACVSQMQAHGLNFVYGAL